MKNNTIKDNIFYLLLVVSILFLSRVIPHPPNFTPILGTAIMAPMLFKNKMLAIFVVIISMFISDIILGFHAYQLVIYSTILLITLFAQKTKNYKKTFFLAVSGSLCFFVITNFAVWITWDYYEKNLYGLIKCYTLALPFFANTLISTILFASLINFLFNNLEEINEKFNKNIILNFNKLNKYRS